MHTDIDEQLMSIRVVPRTSNSNVKSRISLYKMSHKKNQIAYLLSLSANRVTNLVGYVDGRAAVNQASYTVFLAIMGCPKQGRDPVLQRKRVRVSVGVHNPHSCSYSHLSLYEASHRNRSDIPSIRFEISIK